MRKRLRNRPDSDFGVGAIEEHGEATGEGGPIMMSSVCLEAGLEHQILFHTLGTLLSIGSFDVFWL